MDSDSWRACLSSASKRYQSALHSRSDMLMGFEEIYGDDDDDIREEFPCPFCSEYFDIVGLCCHIEDEHPVEAKNGTSVTGDFLSHHTSSDTQEAKKSACDPRPTYMIRRQNMACPVCAMRVGVDMVAHITLQHGNIVKVQRKRKSRKSETHSTLSLLRREIQEGNLPSIFRSSSCLGSSTNVAPDPLLSSFILPMADELMTSQSVSLADTGSTKKCKDDNLLERDDVSGMKRVFDDAYFVEEHCYSSICSFVEEFNL